MFLVPTVIHHTVPDQNHKYDNRKYNIYAILVGPLR